MKRQIKFAALILLLNLLTGCGAYFIPTGSMEDTLKIGDHLFAQKLFYSEPKRGDLVIIKDPGHQNTKEYIKRCIAIPGDRFKIKDGSVFINGKKIKEPYIKGKTWDRFQGGKVNGTVPEKKFVVLGDNRENSLDSRYFGYVDFDDIKGKAFMIYWNTEDISNGNFSRLGFIE